MLGVIVGRKETVGIRKGIVRSERVNTGDERDDHAHGEQRTHDELDVGATQRVGEEREFHRGRYVRMRHSLMSTAYLRFRLMS